ncbi:MAG: CHAT domain-containing protein, partial [Deltaproteobacteria bacterium]|nr:CHAT domain-containing protein [Deltaproteobacteria bacterium]
ENHKKALSIRLKVRGSEHPDTATSYNNIGSVYDHMGDYPKALDNFQKALAIYFKVLGPEDPNTATSYNNIGLVYAHMGDYPKALDQARKALPIAENSGAMELKWKVLDLIGNCYAQQGQPGVAIFWGKQSVNTIQAMRRTVFKMDKEIQKSFMGDKKSVYKRLADWLITQGRFPEAQQVLGLLKEEEYLDFVQRNKTDAKLKDEPVVSSAAEQPWAKQYDSINQEIAGLGKEYQDLQEKQRKQKQLSPGEEQHRKELRLKLEVASRAHKAFLDRVAIELGKISGEKAKELMANDLKNLKSLQATLEELGHGAVVVYYLVLEKKLIILLTTPGTQVAREVPVTAQDLNKYVFSLMNKLSSPNSDYLPEAQRVYSLIFSPIAKDLEQAGAKTVMVSLAGTLRYLPLAALHDKSKFLIEKYTLVVFTDKTKDKLKDAPTTPWKAAGLGVSQKIGDFPALPMVTEELTGIVKVSDQGPGVIPGVIRLDQQFTAKEMLDVLNDRYPVIHLSSHFVFKSTNKDSFLLLGDGDKLSLDQLEHEGYSFRGVDLLTLSACQTAVGGGSQDPSGQNPDAKKANGEEVEGFGVLAQLLGAKGVIATLWPVADASTGLLMQKMYQLHQAQPGVTKAEALQGAQLWLMKEAPGGKYAHPYFWAPFILMGNWR